MLENKFLDDSVKKLQSSDDEEILNDGKFKRQKTLRLYMIIACLVVLIGVIVTAAAVYAINQDYRNAGLKIMDSE
ncbi:hypothetical protein CCM_04427 [Cordyceps militaris CM01]|uniref:Uncharacterized protein n=2 Tax=Cordyceps militaris TaxID=73501 RepID=G3JEU6_CORMM|nr:uncharacterized protein CCM_04427 [Cordyceps militaris CM01]ATY64022.1 hypothetical protein A9K55_004243 [Cordyceps militaris]EGX93055.1 hypothetical protein CCM_04427 [Cordyceps militaris CM01]